MRPTRLETVDPIRIANVELIVRVLRPIRSIEEIMGAVDDLTIGRIHSIVVKATSDGVGATLEIQAVGTPAGWKPTDRAFQISVATLELQAAIAVAHAVCLCLRPEYQMRCNGREIPETAFEIAYGLQKTLILIA